MSRAAGLAPARESGQTSGARQTGAAEQPGGRLRPRALAVCLAAAALLACSWNFGPTRALWNRLDRGVFRALNGTLPDHEWWQLVVALANHREFDLVALGVTVCMLWCFARADGRRHLAARAAAAFMMALFMLIVRQVADLDVIQVDRASPTLVLDDAFRVSKAVHWLDPKDASKRSFPGDHALVLFLFTGYFWFYGGVRWGLRYAFLAVLFSLPRLVGGAHWLTDCVVGSGALALAALGLLFATPLHAWLLRPLLPAAHRLFGRFAAKAPPA